MSSPEAFQALVDIASKTQANALPVPSGSDVSSRQSGIGFSLLGHRFVVPMGQLAEMLDVPESTRLPGVQPWVIGLSNVRGRLLPLFDLAMFFGGTALVQRRQKRVLVVDNDELYCGLVVDQAFGMQHFMNEHYNETIEGIPEAIAPFVKGAYTDSAGVQWGLFDTNVIARYSRFLNAASA